jgi:hypothetical protein
MDHAKLSTSTDVHLLLAQSLAKHHCFNKHTLLGIALFDSVYTSGLKY